MADDAPEPIADTAAFRAFSSGSESNSDELAEPVRRVPVLPLVITAGLLVLAVVVAIIVAL
jgi:hypothetical protein